MKKLIYIYDGLKVFNMLLKVHIILSDSSLLCDDWLMEHDLEGFKFEAQ